MKRFLLIPILAISALQLSAQIDMQAHVASDEGRAAYSDYLTAQETYYTGNFTYSNLYSKDGMQLFALLNTLMGNTCRLGQSGFSYNSLRQEYGKVDKDLNIPSNLIAFYAGTSHSSTWDGGKTWNREHVWPQSKGASRDSSMGHDMLSVRPSITEDNSSRGNEGYGETSGFYDPNEVAINNPYYNPTNNATYRGDCARIILYDYIVYGEMGGNKNSLYNGKAQLLDKLGTPSTAVFESVRTLLRWHMQDPPSVTEIVRNDGGQNYQGNRNPFIDYPELAPQLLKNEITTYSVTSNLTIEPAYRLTTTDGFVAYLSKSDGTHPQTISVSGASYHYEPALGRLTVTNVVSDVAVTSADTPSSAESLLAQINYHISGGNLTFSLSYPADLAVYSLTGLTLYNRQSAQGYFSITLPAGIYILRIDGNSAKIIIHE